MPSGRTTSSPSPDMVSVSLMKPVGSFGTSVSILLALSSSRCFLLFLPTQKNFDGSGIGGRHLTPALGCQDSPAAASASDCSAASVCGPVVSALLTLVAGGGRRSALAAATTSSTRSPR